MIEEMSSRRKRTRSRRRRRREAVRIVRPLSSSSSAYSALVDAGGRNIVLEEGSEIKGSARGSVHTGLWSMVFSDTQGAATASAGTRRIESGLSSTRF